MHIFPTTQYKLVNLTPHPITLLLPNGEKLDIASSGVVRCTESVQPSGSIPIDGMPEGFEIPAITKAIGDVFGLPEPAENTFYIVSLPAAERAWRNGRTDVLAVGGTARDEAGRIVGAVALSVNPYV